MSEEPWKVLEQAADKLAEMAEQATAGSWKWDSESGAVSTVDGNPVAMGSLENPWPVCTDENGTWIAAMSPAVAPYLEAMLRTKAGEWERHDVESYRPGNPYRGENWRHYRATSEYQLALVLLGEEQA